VSGDEKNPFAHLEEFEGILRVVVAGVEVDSELHYEDVWTAAMSTSRRERCAAINAAVEQRETKLHAILSDLAQAAEAVLPFLAHLPHDHRERVELTNELLRVARTIDVTDRYVPAVEHEALKAELAAMRKHIEGTWGVLLNELAETEEWTPIAAALAKELGVKPPKPLPGGVGAKLHFFCAGGDRIDFTVNKVDVVERDFGVVEVALRGQGMRVKPPVLAAIDEASPALQAASEDARTTLSRMTEAIQRQHLEAVERSLIELTASESLMLGHGTAERIYVPAPADGALARDILRSGRLEVEVVTRLVDGVARTTREQRVRPPQD
jgi:hypothetical protein